MIIRNYKFIGADSSLGYRNGQVYELTISKKKELFHTWIVIQRADGTGLCPYSDIETFLANWTCPCDNPEITINSSKSGMITDAFGLPQAIATHLEMTLTQEITNGYFDPADQRSKTQVLKDYINSEKFKQLGFRLNSANNFFLMGYIFASAVESANHIIGHMIPVLEDAGVLKKEEKKEPN